MNRLSQYLMLSALLLAACAKETTQTEETARPASDSYEMMVFHADTDEGLKTTLGSDRTIRWQSWDKITVFSGPDAAGQTFQVKSLENDNKTAVFKGLGLPASNYYALSPAQSLSSISGGSITASLPMVQGALQDSFGAQANLSAAVSDGVSDSFYFRNVGAILAVQHQNSGVVGIKIEALGNQKMTGEAQISFDSAGLPVAAPTRNAHDYVYLNGEAGVSKTYYAAVFPGDYASGFRITLYREGSYAVFNNSKPLLLQRNDNYLLASLPFVSEEKWHSVGTVTMMGDGSESGRKLSFVGNLYGDMNISRNRGTQIEAFANDEYNYEIFTSLEQGKPLYFQDEQGSLYTMMGGYTLPIARSDEARAPEIAEDGVYRVRVQLPYGRAYVQQISSVICNQCGTDIATLDYAGGGVWEASGIALSGNDNRYKFHFTIDGKTQVYGRIANTDAAPTDQTAPSYYYVQPAAMDTWEPAFKFTSGYSNVPGRYFADLRLVMNEDGGHYTHTFGLLDSENLPDLTVGDDLFIQGPGALEAGQQVAYITSDRFNLSLSGAGEPEAISGPSDYNYEIFTRLEAGQKFWFSTDGSGSKVAPNAEGVALVKIASPSQVAYGGVAVTGVYRIRMNLSTGALSMFRVDIVNFKQPGSSYGQNMTYAGKGTWKIDRYEIRWKNQSWNAHEDRYKFAMWISYDAAGTRIDKWYDYANLVANDRPSTSSDIGTDYFYVQPFNTSDWNGCFKYPDYLCGPDPDVAAWTATVSLQMNADAPCYTHSFTQAEAVGATPVYTALQATSAEETFDLHLSANGNVFEGVSTFGQGADVACVATDELGRTRNFTITATVSGVAYMVVSRDLSSASFMELNSLLAEGNAVNGFSGVSGVTIPYVGNGVYKATNVQFAGSSEGNPDAMTPTYPFSRYGRARFTFVKPNNNYAPQFRRLNGTRLAVENSAYGNTSEMQINPGSYDITVDLRSFTMQILPAHETARRITVMGSSVPTGTGATDEKGYMYLFAQNALTSGWLLSNRSVPGNNTISLTERYDDILMDGGDYVVYALSLGNEGIHGASDQAAVSAQWSRNMKSLIQRSRKEGRKVALTANYGRGDFNASDYAYVKALNLDIQQWDVPSVNLLGAVDDGYGRWPSGYQNGDDVSHPNDAGHAEMSYTLVPSMFDAMEAGKALPVRKTDGNLDLGGRALYFTPEATVHPFTIAFYVKTTASGDVLRMDTHSGVKTLSSDMALVSGGALNDGKWHLLAFTHYYAAGFSVLYVDGVEQSRTSERFEAQSFSVDMDASVKELFFWRSGMNELEMNELAKGAMLKSSLEIYAPLVGGSLDNLATSTNTIRLL